MCLEKVRKQPLRTDVSGIGYKVFVKGASKEWEFPFYPVGKIVVENPEVIVPTGRWLTATSCQTVDYEGKYYKVGFHIFATLKGAVKFACAIWANRARAVVKVHYSGINAIGTEDGRKIIVANRMSVEECDLNNPEYLHPPGEKQ